MGQTWVEDGTPPEIAELEARAVEASADGSLWITVRDSGVARLIDSDVEWFSESDGLHSRGVADLTVTADGVPWATGLGGASNFDADRWTPIRDFGSLRPGVVFGMHEVPDGGPRWFATDLGALRRDRSGWTTMARPDGLPHDVVHAVVEEPRGTTWFACRTGLARMSDGRLAVLFPDVNFRSILVDTRGGIWFGSDDGVHRWHAGSWSHDLSDHTVVPRLVADEGAVWAGSADSGVFRFADDRWRPVAVPSRLVGAEVFDVAQSSGGAIWLASARGVARLVAGR